MAVLFDTTFLCHVLTGGTTLAPEIKDKLDYLMETLQEANEVIVIPTPALAEALVPAGDALTAYLGYLTGSAHFRIAPFDQRAAIEVAIAHDSAMKAGDKREGTGSPWTKVKYDRQIVAIGRVENVSVIYSDDTDVATYGARDGVTVISKADLPSRPQDPQHKMDLVMPAIPPADAGKVEEMILDAMEIDMNAIEALPALAKTDVSESEIIEEMTVTAIPDESSVEKTTK